MAVNYQTPTTIHPVAGVSLGAVAAGIKKVNRLDLSVLRFSSGTRVAAVFTRNKFCAAPVTVCKTHLADSDTIEALIINTGIANAGTGASGLNAAKETCHQLAAALGVQPRQILPFSTGVILEPLPVERLTAAIPAVIHELHPDRWLTVAQAIMTTDTVAKAATRQVSCQGQTITISGIAKGAGMICPNMATMLGFIATDAQIDRNLLQSLVTETADHSFNAITVDGDTSTNDSFIVAATGQKPVHFSAVTDPGWQPFRQALMAVALELAQAIVRDGEGATKFISVTVAGGQTKAMCRAVAYSIAHSPLVKTAFFASDPNLGRILAAIGNAKVPTDAHGDNSEIDSEILRVWLAANGKRVLVAEHGGRAAQYQEAAGAEIMQASDIEIHVDLALGNADATVYTCDFSYDYVKINADYRS